MLPQTIASVDAASLKHAAEIFNAHPDLTVFAREDRSYATAQEQFHKCRVIRAPDTVFHLANLPSLPRAPESTTSILELCRRDWEADIDFSPGVFGIPDLVASDWVSFTRTMDLPIYVPGLQRLIRAVWLQGLATPGEWLVRQKWQFLHPNTVTLQALYKPSVGRRSWSMMHRGVCQLQRHRLVITNRLHGHVLSLLLGIPHVLIPGPYGKMEAFIRTWTQHVPFCRFAGEPAHVGPAAEDLLALFPR